LLVVFQYFNESNDFYLKFAAIAATICKAQKEGINPIRQEQKDVDMEEQKENEIEMEEMKEVMKREFGKMVESVGKDVEKRIKKSWHTIYSKRLKKKENNVAHLLVL
jgi:dipeptidase